MTVSKNRGAFKLPGLNAKLKSLQTMNPEELQSQLDGLIADWESEVVEFKRAGNDYDTDKIGRYFSAMANEANLRGIERAWLVFGIDNKLRAVVGSDYRIEKERLHGLKQQIAESTEPAITFRDIHVHEASGGRVVMFEIPAAPQGIPIAWKGHYYARAGESLTALGLDKQDEIRAQTLATDWSAAVVAGATIHDLDPHALLKARENFRLKYSNRFQKGDVEGWPDSVFLDKARLTIRGKLTRTALLLLGMPQSASLLSPHPAQLTWRLDGPETGYEHFGPPFLLTTTSLYQKIRNIQIRMLPEDELLSREVAKYDQKIVMEALHNCLAHQDYRRNSRILVTERPDQLIFENEGAFFEGHPLDYLMGHKTPRCYRNPFLAQAMVELNMIDTMGYGIHEMFAGQARRFLPMPDYDLSEPQTVKIVIPGRIVDPAYTRALIRNTNLNLEEILALDRVQKRLPLDADTAKRLKQAGLIEGRRPLYHVSAAVADAAGNKAAYIRTRALDKGYYRRLVMEFLNKFGHASRSDIDGLLNDKLSDALNAAQKADSISNLLTAMRRGGEILNEGSKKSPRWVSGKKPHAD